MGLEVSGFAPPAPRGVEGGWDILFSAQWLPDHGLHQSSDDGQDWASSASYDSTR
jgi:hypothetical protein